MFRPHQCTETNELHRTDCTWCSGVMLANAAEGRDLHPPVRPEYEALRAASGDLVGGSGLDELQHGLSVRYGWTRPISPSWTEFMAAFDPGTGMVMQGHLSALNAHYNRWNRTRVPHAMYVQREDWQSRAWLQNPLAPQTYAGEWISIADLHLFFDALPGAHWMSVGIASRANRVAVLPLAAGIPRPFKRWRPDRTVSQGWTYTQWATRGFSAATGKRTTITYGGNRHTLVEIADPKSAYNHDWLDYGAAGVTWTGE